MTKRVVVRGIGRAPEPLLRALEDCGVLIAAEGPGEDRTVPLYIVDTPGELEGVVSGVTEGGPVSTAAPFLVYTNVEIPPDLLAALGDVGLAGVITPAAPPEEISFVVNRALFHALGSGRNPRVPVDIPVVVDTGARVIETRASMLSREGAFVNTLNPLEAGAECELAISLPDGGPPVKTGARVLYGAGVNRDISIISSAREPFRRIVSHPGMAVLFTGLDGSSAARIEATVESQG